MRSSICSSFSKIFLGNINIIKKFEKIHLVSNLLFFHRHKGEIDAPVAERRCKFYSIPSFRRYRIQANLYSAGDSRGKPEGPNIIPGTRGSRYAWDLTCIHFPNRRVNVKNTARVFSRRKKKKK